MALVRRLSFRSVPYLISSHYPFYSLSSTLASGHPRPYSSAPTRPALPLHLWPQCRNTLEGKGVGLPLPHHY